MSRLLRPISAGMKRIGKLKVSPRVQGKILEHPSGARFMVVEQKGRDIWRGKHRSIAEAVTAGQAGIGVDRILLQRAEKYGVTNVLVVVEEMRRVFLAPITAFDDPAKAVTRSNWQGRSTRVLGYEFFLNNYLGPNLSTRRKIASA